jgi:hypothetical protein
MSEGNGAVGTPGTFAVGGDGSPDFPTPPVPLTAEEQTLRALYPTHYANEPVRTFRGAVPQAPKPPPPPPGHRYDPAREAALVETTYPTMPGGFSQDAQAAEAPPAAPAEPAPAEPAEAVRLAPEPVADPDPSYVVPLPQGFEADPGQMAQFKQVALKHGLPAEAAGDLVGLYHELQQRDAAAGAALDAQWREQSLALVRDPSDLAAVRLTASLAPPEVKAWLNASRLGDNPAFVKWSLAVGRELARLGGGSAKDDARRIERLYPSAKHYR